MNSQSIIFYFILALSFSCAPTSDSFHSMQIINDYHEGLAKSDETNKPIFLLFTGNACLNNIKVQELIEEDVRVQNKLNTDFVTVHLYVDDQTPLNNELIKTSKSTGREIRLRTIGNKWAFLEREQYDSNAQPLAFIIDKDEHILAGPADYNDIKDDLIGFLNF